MNLLPVRMLTEYVYCPRLFHYMYVQDRFVDNVYTVEGRDVHRRVDASEDLLEKPKDELEGDDAPTISRSVALDSTVLRLTSRLDLVETDGKTAVPVETKRSRVPNNPERSWEPERVQLMAQGLLLREHGYDCGQGVLYFAGSRTRVDVPLSADLEKSTRDYIRKAQEASDASLPRPLEDSPKCVGCSLAGICLPDETLLLERRFVESGHFEARGDVTVRRFFPARPLRSPLYVQEQGAYVGKKGKTVLVKKDGAILGKARIKDISQVVLCGNIGISAQTIHNLCEDDVSIVHLSMGHWFYGITQGMGIRNAYDRARQFDTSRDSEASLLFARDVVRAKITNQRVLLRRNGGKDAAKSVKDLGALLGKLDNVKDIDALRGYEGQGASLYFGAFSSMLNGKNLSIEWFFHKRNRRPPKDPINAMLSFGYALLTKDCTTALLSEGLDAHWGFYHRPRHGRPALSLDLMELFRPAVVDSAVLTCINTGMVREDQFVMAPSGCAMKPAARKAMIRAYENRMDQFITHPYFDYRCSWRVAITLQVRLLVRWLREQWAVYPTLTTR